VGQLDRLLDLIEENCTIEQVKGILRPASGNKDVKVSAPTHRELVQINLRAAVNSHSLDIGRVYDLLRESEENGPQHIFYFRCKNKDIQALLTLDYMRKSIFGSKVPPEPHLDHKPNGFVISEIRPWSSRKPADWALKIYGHEARELPTGEVDRSNPARIARFYRMEEFRFVLLARWNGPDALELRIPETDSRQRLESWRSYLYNTVRVAIPFDRVLPWTLSPVSRRLFDEKDNHPTIYSLGDAKLEDEFHNIYSIQSHAPDSNLFSGVAADSAAKGVLEHNGTHKAQRVLWLKQPDDGFSTDISTLIGARQENEVVFSRHQNSRGIDYVTRQLRSFSKG
jgi:hypothetical protein